MKRIMIMAAGTGGHIFPALAVARKCRAEGIEVIWLGAAQARDVEESIVVRENDMTIVRIKAKGARGHKFLQRLSSLSMSVVAIFQAMRAIHHFKPDKVIGFGGFVCGPGGVAAWLMRKPLLIHEQNAAAGLTNRLLVRFAQQVFQAFPDTFDPQYHAITVGNPLREVLIHLPPPAERFANRTGPLRVLILGGSQGANFFNQTFPRFFAEIPESQRPEVWHVAGEAHKSVCTESYREAGVTANVIGFCHNMAEAYSWADIVIARAGALTVSELAAVGVGSLLIPFPYAVDDHQTYNAQKLVQAGAAVLVQQRDWQPEPIRNYLTTWQHSRAQLQTMAQAAYELRQTDAAEKIVASL